MLGYGISARCWLLFIYYKMLHFVIIGSLQNVTKCNNTKSRITSAGNDRATREEVRGSNPTTTSRFVLSNITFCNKL
jgi:hypothetical protein